MSNYGSHYLPVLTNHRFCREFIQCKWVLECHTDITVIVKFSWSVGRTFNFRRLPKRFIIELNLHYGIHIITSLPSLPHMKITITTIYHIAYYHSCFYQSIKKYEHHFFLSIFDFEFLNKSQNKSIKKLNQKFSLIICNCFVYE